MMRLLSGFLVLAALTVPSAHACDDLVLDLDQDDSGVYDPSDALEQPYRLSIRSANGPLDAACENVTIAITPVGSSNFPLALESVSGELRARAAYAGGVQRGRRLELTPASIRSIVAGGSAIVEMGEALAGQYVAPGEYAAEIDVTYGSQSIRHRYVRRVLPTIDFVGSGRAGRYDLDLGDPSQGPRRANGHFMFKTNASIEFRVTSINQGRLVHQGGDGFGAIAYEASLNGNPLDLNSGPDGFTQTYPAGSAARRGELDVRVGQVRSAYAGRYTDTITVSLTPF